MENLPTNLETVGMGAVALSLAWILYRIVSNHLEHSTKVLVELVEVIRELKEYIKEHHNV